MTAHDAARIKRLTQDKGHFTNCKHYRKTGDRTFICEKTEAPKRSCEGCFICPNCGGMMFTHRLKKDYQRNSLYITHSKSCALCGAYIEEYLVGFTQKKTKQKPEDKCQVEGCNRTAFDGFTYEEDGQSFLICETHRNRLKSWKQHKTKGEDQKPLIILGNRIIDNDAYTIKQGKKKWTSTAANAEPIAEK